MRPSEKVPAPSSASRPGAEPIYRLETQLAAELRSAEDDLRALRRDITQLSDFPGSIAAQQTSTDPFVAPAPVARGGRSTGWSWIAGGALAATAVAFTALGGTSAMTTLRAANVADAPVALAVPAVTTAAPAPVSAPSGEADLGVSVYAARFADVSAAERMCLARAIYYEARGESFEGQVAVAQVVLNRARSKKWPNTLCRVVYQGVQRGEKCQFSFACLPHAEPSGDDWEQAQAIADQAVAGHAWLREGMDATYYHSVSVSPVWRLNLTVAGTIGSHVFYRDREGVKAAPLARLATMTAVRRLVPASVGPAQAHSATGAAAAVQHGSAQVKVEQTRVTEKLAVGSVAPSAPLQRKRPAAIDPNWNANLLQPRF